MMNDDLFKGRWKEIKGEILSAWGRVTGDELDRTNGDLLSIAGLIQQRYGQKKEEISKRLHELIGRFDAPVDRGTEDARRPVSGTLENLKQDLRSH